MPGRYIIFISSLFLAEDILILNALFFALQYAFDIVHDEAHNLLLVLTNLSYLLSVATIKYEMDVRRQKLRNIMQRNTNRILITALIVLICIFALGIMDNISRRFIYSFYILFYCLLSFFHRITRSILTFSIVRSNGKAIILGAGLIGKKVYKELQENTYHGVEVLGFFDDVTRKDVQILGTVEAAKQFVKENNVTRVYCTLPVSAHIKIVDFLNFAEANVVNFYIVPSIGYYNKTHVIVDSIGDMPIFGVRKIPLSYAHNAFVKRALDVSISSLFLITVFPIIWLILGIIIKLSSSGSVFFVQKRTGKGGKTFKCYKFRSMRCNKDAHTRQATANDDRKTRIGNFLRKTNLDELPQFINVFKGDMSIVGPRPHMLLHTEEYSRIVDKYMVRHFIKPGITGWAQINGCRGETRDVSSMEERIKKDIWYIENWSLLLDVEIVVRTIRLTLTGDKKAY